MKKNTKRMIVSLMTIMLLMSVPMVLAADVSVTFDIDGGSITIENNGVDHSTWHPGTIGETNTFTAMGDFFGTYSSSEGTFGKLATYINAESGDGAGWASFKMTDYQDFDILVANHNHDVEGYMYAEASGYGAEMNLKSIGSMYVWSEATNPGSAFALAGQYIEKNAYVTQGGVLQGGINLWVGTDGLATMSNSAAWGWSISESGSVTTNYGGGTRTVSATGDGEYFQTAFGADYLSFNGVTLNDGGSASILGWFTGGYTGTYTMSGN